MASAAKTVPIKRPVLHESDKDITIATLYQENRELESKIEELEETVDMYKAKTESLEQQLADLQRAHYALKEQMDAKITATPMLRVTSESSLEEKRPVSPTNISSTSMPSVSSPKGWATASVSRRETISGRTTRSSMMLPKLTDTPPASPTLSAVMILTPEQEKADIREERAKTSPIPGPSPSVVPQLTRSVTSISLSEAEGGGSVNLVSVVVEEEEVVVDSPDLVVSQNEETGKVMVKGGTLDKLVERLSYEKSPDAEFVAAFLLTYRSFTTQTELLDKLLQRYNIAPNEGITPEEDAAFIAKRKIIRLRIGNTLKMWVDRHFHDFEQDVELVTKLGTFVDTQLLVDLEAQGKTIKKLLYKERVPPVLSWSEDPPPLLSPKLKDTFKDFDPLEVARQLTLIEQELYRSIETKECLNQSWNKTDKEERAPHIVAMIKRFNLVSIWVATEIVKIEKLPDRVHVMKKFLNIAVKCREIGNFNAIMEILAGLQNSAIYRLKKSWERLFNKSNYQEMYDGLMGLMNNKGNFKDYRAALHKCQPPCIPYLGVYLTDLTFIEDGMKNTLNNRDDLINFDKRRKLSTVIHEIQQYQQTPYHYLHEDTIRSYLLNIEGLTEKALYKYSLLCEPREAKVSAENSSSSFLKDLTLPSFFK